MAVEVSLEAALREACLALGEALVRERLLLVHVAELEAAVERLAPPEGPGAGEPARSG